ncbi:MAG: MotA/TolQ/ExbB proton channel family protein [Limnochordales bacterium]|nr:MotA/TolQ/ExbB proton channel family protein [Bacillota bacterium]
MVDIIVKGGPVMIPLLFISVLALAVSLERLWYFFSTRVDSDDLMDEVRLNLTQGKVMQAVQVAKRSKSQVAALIATAVAYSDLPLDQLKEKLEDVGRAELFKMERRMVLLETVVNIAPLLGLLGTVTGIIRSFNVLGALEGLATPQDLSLGVAEALITTAAGLSIAIPAMAVYHWLSSIIDRRVADMNRRTAEILEIISTMRGE